MPSKNSIPSSAPTIDWTHMHGAEHFVQFYEQPAQLFNSVGRYFGMGLQTDVACIALAQAAHLGEIEHHISSHGIDLQAARRRGQYVAFEGEQLLSQLIVDGHVNRDVFFEVAGQAVADACNAYPRVRVFGELVAMLCKQGNYAAAQALESLWNELGTKQSFALYCAYPMSCFNSSQHSEAFARACACHARVIPAEDYLAQPNTASRLQVVSKLQQKAVALEHEIETRKLTEQKLAARESELTDFIENASEALHKVDAHGKILWANKAELQMLGYAAEEYIGCRFVDFHVDAQCAEVLLHKLIAGDTVLDQSAQIRCKDGSIKHVLISSNSYREAGKFLYTRCFTRDISAQIHAEHVLREEVHAWQTLSRSGTALANELELEKLVQTITDAAVALTRAKFGAFFYRVEKPHDHSYLLYSLCGASREKFADFPLLSNAELFAAAFRGDGVVRIVDVQSGANADHLNCLALPLSPLPVRSYLAAPVMSHSGEVHGALCFGHPDPGVFTATDELIARGIAAQAAVAIDNARLFKASQQAEDQLRTLNETLEQRVQQRSEELKRSELQFSRLVDGVADYAIYMLDVEGYVVNWNAGAARIKGYHREEIVGRHFSLFYSQEDRATNRPQRALEIAIQAGKYEAEGWRVRKDGTRFWASVLLDALHDEAGQLLGFAKVTRDMTERRAWEERLHQSQKLEAIGQLTGGVAHDFNNMLTVILGNLETIFRRNSNNDLRLRQAIDSATRGAQRAATLTQQLLAFSRRQALNPKRIDINSLVAGMTDLLRRTLGDTVAIETVLTGGSWWAEVDSHQLETALLNLAVNARDAMQETGGKLTIVTGNTTIDESRDAAGDASNADLTPGEYVVISVSDTGVGMSAEVVARAFEPFFTTKALGQGTGLGLSQVYGFVKQSGGHIKISSEPNMGTTIDIYLQRMTGSQAAALESAEASDTTVIPRSKDHETILVVEDDSDVRRYSTDSLRELGFTVLEAAEATAALHILDEHPEVLLLFTDIGLPGMNGRELAKQALLRRPNLKVLFTTGYARDVIMHQGRLEEGVELLSKPFTRLQLAHRVREVLDSNGSKNARPAVLVVDDEALVAQFLAETLEDMGFRVITAGTVADALVTAKTSEPLAAALVDLGLPDRSGLELIAELQKLRPRLPVLIATGYAAMAKRDIGEDHRPPNYLAKPYNAESISKALYELGIKIPQRMLN
jgi:PAS domain S-box-containing protein